MTGQVTSDSGTPIPGATITISSEGGSSLTAVTDKSGKWSLASVPEGKCKMTVTAKGFESASGMCVITKGCSAEITLVEEGYFGDATVSCGCPNTGANEPKKSSVGKAPEDPSGDDSSDAGGCTNLYVLDDNGREHFIAFTLTAIGVENERWESRAIPIPVTGNITIRLVKEMPRETTFIDQVRLGVKEINAATGEIREYDLEGIAALKNRSKKNLMTAFRKDGNHISIYSSREPDPGSRWGVKKGDFLEVTFKVPPSKPGYKRQYYVLTFGYHIIKPMDLK
ncbi:carboxypeptidase-like regulatory domain-containing protein [Thermodesulfobacteriota bacterium]